MAMKFSYLVPKAIEWLGPRMNPLAFFASSKARRTSRRASSGVPAMSDSSATAPQTQRRSPNRSTSVATLIAEFVCIDS